MRTDRRDSNIENHCAEIFLSAAREWNDSKYFIRAYKLLFITRNIININILQ